MLPHLDICGLGGVILETWIVVGTSSNLPVFPRLTLQRTHAASAPRWTEMFRTERSKAAEGLCPHKDGNTPVRALMSCVRGAARAILCLTGSVS